MCAEAKRARAGDRAPAGGAATGLEGGARLARLLRSVERIVVEAHRSVFEVKGRGRSEPAAYQWLSYEDPDPVGRLSEGLAKLRRRGAQVDDNAVDKACRKARRRGFLN